MYVQQLPSSQVQYGCLTNTNRVAATFDDVDRARAYRDRVDPSWRIIEITNNFTEVKEPKAKKKKPLQLVAGGSLAIAA